jgi:hypothetical protein
MIYIKNLLEREFPKQEDILRGAMTGKYASPQSSNGQLDRQYSLKKGIGYGAFGGFIAIVAFTGIMLGMPIIQGLPTGSFIDALGMLILGTASDQVLGGIVGFGIILAQGVIVGIIFGIVISKIKILHPYNNRRGIYFGLVTGTIAFLVLYLPGILATISTSLVKYPPADVYTMGTQTGNNNNNNDNNNRSTTYSSSSSSSSSIITQHLPITLAFGIFAYLVYGFFVGAIVTLAYSVLHFDLKRMEEYDDKGQQQHERSTTTT